MLETGGIGKGARVTAAEDMDGTMATVTGQKMAEVDGKGLNVGAPC